MMSKDDMIQEVKDGWLFTPDDVVRYINEADKYPSVDTIKKILEIASHVQEEAMLYDYKLSIDDIVQKVSERICL